MAEKSPMAAVVFDTQKISEAIEKAANALVPKYEFLELPEEIFKIFDYLPELFQDDSEKDYIGALSTAMQTSYENGLYQFAFMQYHMLFMTAVYFVLLKIYWLHEDETKKALYYLLKDHYSEFFGSGNTKNGDLFFGSFAAISESEVFKILHIKGMDSSLEGELKKLVRERNDYAHANGRLLLTSEEFFLDKITAFNRCIDRVFSLIKDDMMNVYLNLLTDVDFYDPDIRAYMDADQQVQEGIVRAYSLSKYEINWLRKYKIDQLKDHKDYESIKELHIALCRYYKSLHDED